VSRKYKNITMGTERNRDENCKIGQQNKTEGENPRGTNVKGEAYKKKQAGSESETGLEKGVKGAQLRSS
jgi:hypothetical protein